MQQKQYSNGRSVLCDITNCSRLDKKLLKIHSDSYTSNNNAEKTYTQASTPAKSRLQTKHSLIFPPGPMGLELEPVITSSERQIGCRIKDYYFGIDHNGISEVDLKNNVQPGDVIVDVNSVSVLSFPFLEILEMLRNLRTESKTITFKNMTASWNNENDTPRSFHELNKENITDINRKEKLSSGSNFSIWTEPSEKSEKTSHKSIIYNDTSSKTPIKALFPEGNVSSEVEKMPTSDSSKNRNTLDNVIKHPHRAVIKFRNQVMQETDLEGEHSTSNHTIKQQQNEHSRSKLKPAQTTSDSSSTTSALLPISDNVITKANTPHNDYDNKDNNHIAVNQALSIVGSHIGTGVVVAGAMVGHRTVGIVQAAIGSTLGKCASDAASVVGSIVSDQAERTVGDTLSYLPLYSSREMELISNSKVQLLQELSQSYIKLDELEKSNTLLQLQHDNLTTNTNNLRTTLSEIEIELNQLRETNKDLMSRNNQLILDKDQLHQHSQSTESEMNHLREEIRKFSSNNSKLSFDLTQERVTVDKLQEEVTVLRKQSQTLEEVKVKLQLQFEGHMQSHKEELGIANNKILQATNQIVSLQRQWDLERKNFQHEIQSIQEAKDKAICELEVLQDTLTSDKATTAAEVSRLRDSLMTLQETHRQRLQESELTSHSLQQELVETVNRLTIYKKEVEDAVVLQNNHTLNIQMKSETLSNQQTQRIKALESQISMKDSELLELHHTKKLLEEKFQGFKLQYETKNTELDSTQSQLVQLQKELTTRQLELNNVHYDLVRIENECQNLQSKLSLKESENISLRNEVHQCKSHIMTLTESLTNRTHNLQLEKDNYCSLKQILVDKDSIILELQQNCESLRINKEDLEAKLQVVQSDLQSTTSHMKSIEDSNVELSLSLQHIHPTTPSATPSAKTTQTNNCQSLFLLKQLYSQKSELKLILKDLQLYVITMTKTYNESLSFMKNKLMEECSHHVTTSSSDYAILNARVSILSMEKAVAIERRAEIESSLLEMETKVAATQLANINNNNSKDPLEANQDIELKYVQLQSELSQLQQECNRLNDMKQLSEETSRTVIKELESKLSECHRLHKEMEVELSEEMMAWKLAANDQRVRYEAAKVQAEAEIVRLSTQCEELQMKLLFQEKDHHQQLADTIDRTRNEERLTQTQAIQQLANQLDDCSKKLLVSETELQLTMHQLTLSNNDFINQQQISQQLHSELSAKDSNIMDLTSDLQHTQSELTTFRMNFEELQLKYQEISKELTASELIVKQLQELKYQLENELHILKSQHENQENVIKDKVTVIESLQGRLSSLETQLVHTNHLLQQSESEIEHLKTRNYENVEKSRSARLSEEDTQYLLTTQLRDKNDRIEGLEMELEAKEKELAAVTLAKEKELAAVTIAKEKELAAVTIAKEKELAAVTLAKETLSGRFYELISALTAQGEALKEAEARMSEWLVTRARFESMVQAAEKKAKTAAESTATINYELINERLQFESNIVKLQQEKAELVRRVSAAEEVRSYHLHQISIQESKLMALEQKIVNKIPTIHESTSTDDFTISPPAHSHPLVVTPGTTTTSTSTSTSINASIQTDSSSYDNTVYDPIPHLLLYPPPPPPPTSTPCSDMYTSVLNEIKVYTESAAHLLTTIKITLNSNIKIADNSTLAELTARINGIRKLITDYQSTSFTTPTPPTTTTIAATDTANNTIVLKKAPSTVSMRKQVTPLSVSNSSNAQSRHSKQSYVVLVTATKKSKQLQEETTILNSQNENNNTSQKLQEKKFDFSYIILHIIIKLQRAIIRKNIHYHHHQHQQNNTIASFKYQLQQSEGKEKENQELMATIRCLRELVTEERAKCHIMTTRFLTSLERLRSIRILYKSFSGLIRNVNNHESKSSNKKVAMSLDFVSPLNGYTCHDIENTHSLSSPSPPPPTAAAAAADTVDTSASVNQSSKATSPALTITPERQSRNVLVDSPRFWDLSPDSPSI